MEMTQSDPETPETPVIISAPKKTIDIFETEVCSRCWGSGNYSYCQRYGTTCFKCAGKKRYLSKHGQKNYDAWRAAVDAATIRPMSELMVGQSCRANDNFKKYYKVVAISEPRKGSAGHYANNDTTTEVIWNQVVDITFDREITTYIICGDMSFKSVSKTFEVEVGGTVRIFPGKDKMPQPEDFVTVKRTRKTSAAPKPVKVPKVKAVPQVTLSQWKFIVGLMNEGAQTTCETLPIIPPSEEDRVNVPANYSKRQASVDIGILLTLKNNGWKS